MYTFLLVIYILVCFFMVIIVLLQQGKGSGMGAAFGGSGQTLFGSRGQTTPLQKITTVMAFLFMALSVALASMSSGAGSALAEEVAKPGEEAGLLPDDSPGMGTQGEPKPTEADKANAAQPADETAGSAAKAAPTAEDGTVPSAEP